MSIFDHHRIRLHPEIWQPNELALTARANSQIYDQISRRFPEATDVFLLGELVGHYYSDQPILDIAIMTPPEWTAHYQEECSYATGYKLAGTNVTVWFHVFPSALNPDILARKFGPIYDVKNGTWIGIKVHGLTEMSRPEAILQRIRWILYRDKNKLTMEQPDWRVVLDAVQRLTSEERVRLIDSLREVLLRLRYNITDLLQQHPDAALWQRASAFSDALFIDSQSPVNLWTIEDAAKAARLPDLVFRAMMNAYRYFYILQKLQAVELRVQKEQQQEDQVRGPVLVVQEY